jgi:hypothetical protein
MSVSFSYMREDEAVDWTGVPIWDTGGKYRITSKLFSGDFRIVLFASDVKCGPLKRLFHTWPGVTNYHIREN